jgi:hypothetical protein
MNTGYNIMQTTFADNFENLKKAEKFQKKKCNLVQLNGKVRIAV